MCAEGGVLALARGGEEGPEGLDARAVAVGGPGAGAGVEAGGGGGHGGEEVPFAEGDDFAVVGGRGSRGRGGGGVTFVVSGGGGGVDYFEEADGWVGGEEVKVPRFEVGEDRGGCAVGPDGAVARVGEEGGEVDSGEGGEVGGVGDRVEF